ncbi:hypothetical protein APUTEX25_004115 [Auxenochlorella protothecoides]|uniref:Uncharacterized protein n=1 Tax=Auxenochlorella protothecoides TaxID=3075 RepID=A0A3M7L3H5_AUXPR|nr:hypothetical protein APUTEX25_004115 [Auxenochlorella protothecoides]|eukprot:RMZ57281.1 hypothetical protein APUTEX25_004115 [Auxenochlorella protothecoides]
MLFGALHKYDSGSKARLEAIFVQRYPKLKAAAATSTEAYVAVGFKMLEALLEFLPEDRLISFMHKKDRDGDIDEILGADAFIDMEQETDTLMAGLQVQRTQGLASVAASQTLSEWRLGNECVKQMRAAGLKVLKPECFEVIQRAFQSQAETLLRRAMAGGPGRAKLFGGPAKVTEETETLTLPDLLTAMERDRHYAKSSLLYTWRNRLVQG